MADTKGHEYELRLRFTAANEHQAERLAEAWAGTCAAEYGTRFAGVSMVAKEPPARLGRHERAGGPARERSAVTPG